MSSWSWDCFCLMRSSRLCLSTYGWWDRRHEVSPSVIKMNKKTGKYLGEANMRMCITFKSIPCVVRVCVCVYTSRFWHSWAELVGRPIHLISFFSFEMIFMAMSTLSASYTRRRIFFWSYTCYMEKGRRDQVGFWHFVNINVIVTIAKT